MASAEQGRAGSRGAHGTAVGEPGPLQTGLPSAWEEGVVRTASPVIVGGSPSLERFGTTPCSLSHPHDVAGCFGWFPPARGHCFLSTLHAGACCSHAGSMSQGCAQQWLRAGQHRSGGRAWNKHGSKFLCEGGAPGPLVFGGTGSGLPAPLPCMAGLCHAVSSHSGLQPQCISCAAGTDMHILHQVHHAWFLHLCLGLGGWNW
jgi:hypothetical protein